MSEKVVWTGKQQIQVMESRPGVAISQPSTEVAQGLSGALGIWKESQMG